MTMPIAELLPPMSKIAPKEPTTQAYGEFQKAYDFFNERLFAGQLPRCLITLQRKSRAYGYFCGERFVSTGDVADHCDEIAMNPTHFRNRTAAQTFSTLAHEMAHLWQMHLGNPPKDKEGNLRAYHNLEWAAKMEAIGLYPSSTAKPGGKRTGAKVSHYIIEGGPFDIACKELLTTGLTITWSDANEELRKKKASTRSKYVCPMCQLAMWGKPEALISCMTCEETMEEE